MYFIISTNLFGNLKKRSYEFEQIDFVVVTNTGDSDFRARLTHFSTKHPSHIILRLEASELLKMKVTGSNRLIIRLLFGFVSGSICQVKLPFHSYLSILQSTFLYIAEIDRWGH